MTIRFILALVLALGAAEPLWAQGAPVLSTVRAMLEATQAITVFDHVTASASGGVITLEGKVTSRAKRDQIETEVATVPGVRQIVNRVAVLGTTAGEDELRHRVARAIYGHTSFRRYAAMSQPPIRVLVDGSRVALAGEVGTAVERLVALSLAEAETKKPVDDQLVVRDRTASARR
ncbi:MAG: BON domain-containing protein [Acidobacteriota bacterium]|nr:BON domain-containing protein [Acidobacteriota bacterium]